MFVEIIVLALVTTASAKPSFLINADDDTFMHAHAKGSGPVRDVDPLEYTAEFWTSQAKATVDAKLKEIPNTNIAKNVIMFLGDGMSIPTLKATRLYLGELTEDNGEAIQLSFEKFPYSALSKTYCVDVQVPDSACTATAYLSGVKTNEATIGVTASVAVGDCAASLVDENRVSSIGRWSQLIGKRTGIVTSTRVTHASPAGVYAHTADRDWEGYTSTECDDIALQLVRGATGQNFNVILGGGRREFLPEGQTDEEGANGNRLDDLDLIKEWLESKAEENAEYVWNRTALLELPDETDYVLGLFEASHCRYHLDADSELDPSLEEMTEAAIKILSKGENGYFLFVEGGRIDHAHHATKAHKAFDETVEFSKAVQKAYELTSNDDTLIVVTADHAHSMTVNGYPARGSSVFGTASKGSDGIPSSTISYANGPGYRKDEDGVRYDCTKDEMSHPDYEFPALAPLDSETHGGDEVAIFATGPWAHLFTGVVEQNVIPHIMAYASCVGAGAIACEEDEESGESEPQGNQINEEHEEIHLKAINYRVKRENVTHEKNGEDDSRMHPRRRKTRSSPIVKINPEENTADFWIAQAQATLEAKIKQEYNTNPAKNVIMFLGDGLSIPTLKATRIYLAQSMDEENDEAYELSFEKFPYAALSKTYCVDAQVPDSACTATAYLGGVKNNDGTLGVTATVRSGDCAASLLEENRVTSIGRWSQLKEKKTGIVTTTRVTHASPAGLYAHSANRDWEGSTTNECDDIALQLVQGETGKNLNVILGGGRREFLPRNVEDEEAANGNRRDERNLIEEWLESKEEQNAAYVWNRTSLLELPDTTDYILGLFESDHCNYITEADPELDPTLEEMTEAAIKILSKGENGYFLFVEGGRIDHAHHDTIAHKALDETVEFAKAIQKAYEMTDSDDTLIVVTADHAHVMTVNGYPSRGNDIFGTASLGEDGIPIATLSYANGPGYRKDVDDERYDCSKDEMDDVDYKFPGLVPLNSETHGGDDVAIFATGPWAHLFSGVMEQNVIPYIMAYASCVGDGPIACLDEPSTSTESSSASTESSSVSTESSSVSTESSSVSTESSSVSTESSSVSTESSSVSTESSSVSTESSSVSTESSSVSTESSSVSTESSSVSTESSSVSTESSSVSTESSSVSTESSSVSTEISSVSPESSFVPTESSSLSTESTSTDNGSIPSSSVSAPNESPPTDLTPTDLTPTDSTPETTTSGVISSLLEIKKSILVFSIFVVITYNIFGIY